MITDILIEDPDGLTPLTLPEPWHADLRPWRFQHVDGRTFDAVGQQGDVWIYRTVERAKVRPFAIVATLETADGAFRELVKLRETPELLEIDEHLYALSHATPHGPVYRELRDE